MNGGTLLDRLREHLPTLLFGGGMGVSGVIAYTLIEREPRLALQVIQSWGAPAILCMLGMLLVDRGVRKLVDAAHENAEAQQRLADAVQEIAKRDDTEAQEQRALMNHVAAQTEKILTRFDDLQRQIAEKGAHGASA